MNTKQVVAVIGASGKMGSAIAKSLAKGKLQNPASLFEDK